MKSGCVQQSDFLSVTFLESTAESMVFPLNRPGRFLYNPTITKEGEGK